MNCDADQKLIEANANLASSLAIAVSSMSSLQSKVDRLVSSAEFQENEKRAIQLSNTDLRTKVKDLEDKLKVLYNKE